MQAGEIRAGRAGEGCEALCAMGFNFLMAGDYETAEGLFSRAVARDPDYVYGYLGWAKSRLPGAGYIEVIGRLVDFLKPHRYVEIGVEKGAVLRLLEGAVRVVGIDPAPQLDPVPENSTIFPLPSDEFFAGHDLSSLLGGPFDLAFIDGLHVFEQVLRDFINLEKYAGPGSVILIHDCLPLDRRTAQPERETVFWTGDVWKIIPCLRQERPELELFTIPTYPAGLCVVSGLRPGAVWPERYADIAARYRALDYAAIGERESRFSLIPNRWECIEERLRPVLARRREAVSGGR